MSKSLGEKIRKRLGAFAAALENREAISERFTCRTIKLQLEPQAYNPQQVKGTRQLLGVSQAIFARFLGVSVKAVSAWEQGAKTPSDMACRFMDEIRHNPRYWQDRLRESAVRKQSV
jgi:putative transcriptional regulator